MTALKDPTSIPYFAESLRRKAKKLMNNAALRAAPCCDGSAVEYQHEGHSQTPHGPRRERYAFKVHKSSVGLSDVRGLRSFGTLYYLEFDGITLH